MAVWDYKWYKDFVVVVTAIMAGILIGDLILNETARYMIFAIAGLLTSTSEGIRLFSKNKGKSILNWVFSDVVSLILETLVLACAVWLTISAL